MRQTGHLRNSVACQGERSWMIPRDIHVATIHVKIGFEHNLAC